MRDLWWGLRERLVAVRVQLEHLAFDRKLALHGAAAVRIGTGLAVLGMLLSNFSSRQLLAGPASVWADPARAVSTFPEIALLRNVSPDIVTVVYVATTLAALAFVVGWHTRMATVLTLVGFIAIVGQNPVVGGQGDNLIRLTLLWLLLVQTAAVWSLDARRQSRSARRRRPWDPEEVVPRWLSTSLHNLGLLGLGMQTVLVYMSAGLDKVASESWQHGNALYYTMQLPEYRPYPWLADLLSGSEVLLAVVTYAVLLVQLFFGPLLLNRHTRGVVLSLAIVVNVLFAVVFAVPWSSLAIIAVTCLFVPTSAFEALDGRVRDVSAPVGDWLAERGYDVADRLDALRYRLFFPVVDWVRERLPSR